MVGPDYLRPEVVTPARIQGSAEGMEDRGSRPTASIAGPWWRVFKDPILDQLVPQVAIDNQNLDRPMRRPIAKRRRVVREDAIEPVPEPVGQPAPSTRARSSGSIARRRPARATASWEIDLWGKDRAARSRATEAGARRRAPRELADLTLSRASDARHRLFRAALSGLAGASAERHGARL